MKKIFLAILVALSLVGCATAPPTTPTSAAATHMKCERTEQVGCIEIDVLNARWDATSPLMKGLDVPHTNADERRRRALELGPALYQAYKAGRVSAAGPRSFTVYVWNLAEVPTSKLASYWVDGRQPPKQAAVNEIRGGGPQFDPIAGLGKPDRIFRIEAAGEKPIGAALQLPWTAIGPKTYILVCTEDKQTVYPNRLTANEGLWLTPEFIAAAKERGWAYVLLPFLSLR